MGRRREDRRTSQPLIQEEQFMEELLKQLLGKMVDVTCGTNATFRGDVVDVKTGVVYLRDEDDEVAYVAIDKIAVVYEIKADHTRPGFIG